MTKKDKNNNDYNIVISQTKKIDPIDQKKIKEIFSKPRAGRKLEWGTLNKKSK